MWLSSVTERVMLSFMLFSLASLLCVSSSCSECTDSYPFQVALENDMRFHDCLCEHDALIVFSSVVDKKEQVFIVVKLYRKGNAAAEHCMYFTDEQILPLIGSDKSFYYKADLYKLIWQPLEKHLTGIRNVYFLPSDLLSTVSFEYCKDEFGRMFCEKYNTYRISSPSVLKYHDRNGNSHSKVSIWGGIEYCSDLAGVEKYEYSDSAYLEKCDLGYLDDSYRAAKLINDELQEQGMNSNFYHGELATEGQFKSEKWDDTDIFFIETHGLFLNNYNLAKNKGKDDPMKNHALAFAGACYALEGGIVPDSIDDGILTSKEISELDLHNVDLAVVSACKSALGEIRADGVYGLMRGFKQAGVKSLIMATDDIVDYVSGQLWIQLFRNLAKGMTKREALLEGLKYIRTMDDGAFSHPKYWTPFILIDGVE